MKLQLVFLATLAAICRADSDLLDKAIFEITKRFSTRVTAVNNLHRSVVVADTSNFDKWPLCCDAKDLSETLHSDFDVPVDKTLACRQEVQGGSCIQEVKHTNQTTSVPSVLEGIPTCANSVPGQEFYDACKMNSEMYEGIRWHYWGSKTGMSLYYPAYYPGATTCDTGTYNYRTRSWYNRASTSENLVHFSEHYIHENTAMVNGSRAVHSLEDRIFQGVVGIEMDLAYMLKPLKKIDALEDSYSFVIDGTNGKVVAHPKLSEIPNFLKTGSVFYRDVEPNSESEIEPFNPSKKIAGILNNPSATEFTYAFDRFRTYRNKIPDNAEVKSAAEFWSFGFIIESGSYSCRNLKVSGAVLNYTVCVVTASMSGIHPIIFGPLYLLFWVGFIKLMIIVHPKNEEEEESVLGRSSVV